MGKRLNIRLNACDNALRELNKARESYPEKHSKVKKLKKRFEIAFQRLSDEDFKVVEQDLKEDYTCGKEQYKNFDFFKIRH
jgi:hypothetical protein